MERGAILRGMGLLGVGLAVFIAGAGPAGAAPSLEYAVKAAYLTKFIPFITWPQSSFATPNSPVTLCLLGEDPFGGLVDSAAHSPPMGDRSITVRHLAQPEAGCQMIFLPAADPQLAAQTLEQMQGKPVVTVTDSGLDMPGIISFVIDDNHVRFDIDEGAADRDGVAISSKLLSLAHRVQRRSEP